MQTSVFGVATRLCPQCSLARLGVLALLLGNLFIVGINQIYDVEIDTVNKPFLPIAAGELSPATAKALLAICAVVGPTIATRRRPSRVSHREA